MIGRVVSVKMSKTAAILVESTKKHPLYGKMFVQSKKYLAEDEIGVKLGDVVEIIKVKPISKRKHWRITKVLGTDIVALGTEILKQEATEAISEVLPEEDKKDVEVNSEVQNIVEPEKTIAKDNKPKVKAKKEEKGSK